MTESPPNSHFSFLRRPAVQYALVVGVAGLALAWYLAPRRVREVASVDDALRWSATAAPPQRSIVWRPAIEVDTLPAAAKASDSTIRPHLADGGTTLYFTLRRDGHTDVFRSRLTQDGWSPGEAVNAWNSSYDDIGPTLSQDGRHAYLYSDRPGGYGGFDLYVSSWDGRQWSQPRNLGPRVNSPAHEYDPALAPDGDRLYFASNRTARMQQYVASGEVFERGEPWNTTLRAHRDALPFDLYVVEREDNARPWSAPKPLLAINLPQSSEGSPCLSPNGAFLYFASDRPAREGEPPNLDLYRARVHGARVWGVENLGAGINTPLNELEPALSPEGFRLYFSRNRDDQKARQTADETYALFASTAVEVTHEAAWDATRWSRLVGWFSSHWWWLILGLLLAALLAAMIWCLREISLRRATVPVFFTLALLMHLFLITGSFFVGLDDNLMRMLPPTMREIIVAEESYDDPNEAEVAPLQPFEQTADLEIEPISPTDVARQTPTDAAPSPVVTAVRISSDTPLPPGRVVYEAPPPQESPAAPPPAQEPTLTRRMTELPETVAAAELEALPEPAPAATDSPAPPSERVELARQAMAPGAVAPPALARRAALPDNALVRETVERASPASSAPAPTNNPSLSLARNQPAPVKPAAAESVATEAMTAPAATPREMTPAAEVAIARPTAPATLATAPARLEVALATPATVPTFDADAPAESPRGAEPPPATSAPLVTPERAALDVAAVEEGSTIQTDLGALADAVIMADTDNALRAEVALPRQATTAPVAPRQMAREIALSHATPAQPESGQVAPEPVEATAAPAAQRTEVALARVAAPAPENRERADELLLAEVGPRPAETGGELMATGPEVAVARQASDAPEAAERAGEFSLSESATDLAGPTAAQELGAVETVAPQLLAARPAADLRRSAPTAGPEETAIVEIGASLAMTADARDGEAKPAAADVALARQNAALPGAARLLPVSLARMNGPSRSPGEHQDIVEDRIETAPTFGPSTGDLARRDSRSPLLMYAEDDIGLQAMLRLRQSEAKEDLLEAFGGNDETEAAVRRGLTWLEQHQHRDGHWSLNQFSEQCQEHHPGRKCGGGGRAADTAATGFALLPFLGAGHTHHEGEHRDCVGRGLTWLVSHQKENGDLFTGGGGNGHMYSHGVAAIALCEAYAMTKDPALKIAAQRSLDFIAKAQHASSGGWRYSPGQDGDTSVFGWQIMALKSGQMAGLNVSRETLDRAKKWLDRVGAQGSQLGQFGYTNSHPSAAMSAEALLCLQYLGAERNDPRLLKGGDYLLAHLPPTDTSYYWYYGTQVMYHLQGEHWRQWNDAQRDLLVKSQVKEGSTSGTWDPKDRWEHDGGRIYATALRLLMLEVYYRHLPLYQALE